MCESLFSPVSAALYSALIHPGPHVLQGRAAIDDLTSNASACRIRLADGRVLGYSECGNPHGRPVLYFHGFPASRLEAGLMDAAAWKNDVRVIAPDRPGYGLSSFQPNRRIADWPDDVIELVDTLDLERFSIVGVSGGGPYALACAWKIPSRLLSAGIVCGLGPLDQQKIQEMEGYPQIILTLARSAPWLLSLFCASLFSPLVRRYPPIVIPLLVNSRVAYDRRVLNRPEVVNILQASVREALRNGPRGLLQELSLFISDWGFRPEDIAFRIEHWHGERDPVIPVSHGRSLAERLPDVRSRIIPCEGHISLPIRLMDLILLAIVDRK